LDLQEDCGFKRVVKTIAFAVSPPTAERKTDVLHLRYLLFGLLMWHREVVGSGFVVVVVVVVVFFSPLSLQTEKKRMPERICLII